MCLLYSFKKDVGLKLLRLAKIIKSAFKVDFNFNSNILHQIIRYYLIYIYKYCKNSTRCIIL